MNVGEFLTRAFVWIALAGYATSVTLQFTPSLIKLARWLWCFGAMAFVLHVAFAFHFFHNWSHTAALIETAKQTKELTGFESGSGLYLNYAFTLLWVVDAGWWLASGDDRYSGRTRWVSAALHGFFVFMFVNGAIVFGKGPVRWYGAAVIAMMLLGIQWARSQRSAEEKS